jgi:hypothetical protein
VKIEPKVYDDFPELPEGEPIHVRIVEIEATLDEKYPNKDGSPKDRLKIVFQPLDPELEESRIFAFPAQSWHPKCALRDIVIAAHGRLTMADEELYAVDTDDLVGKELLITGKYKDPNDRRYLKAEIYKPLKKRSAAAAAVAAAAAAPAAPAEAAPAGALDI